MYYNYYLPYCLVIVLCVKHFCQHGITLLAIWRCRLCQKCTNIVDLCTSLTVSQSWPLPFVVRYVPHFIPTSSSESFMITHSSMSLIHCTLGGLIVG